MLVKSLKLALTIGVAVVSVAGIVSGCADKKEDSAPASPPKGAAKPGTGGGNAPAAAPPPQGATDPGKAP